MIRKLILVGLWFPATISVLLISVVSFYKYSQVRDGRALAKEIIREQLQSNGYQMYAALPSVLGSFTTALETQDARPEIIQRYLQKYQSPLLPYAGEIVKISDKNNLDFRLMMAIAQCESNVCKRMPEGSYNCWGFENGATKFSSWEQALQQVAKTLKEGYIDQGLITPEQIMPKYAPPSVEKGGPWAKCVSHFLEEME